MVRLVVESERVAHVASVRFPSRYLSGPLPYVRRNITVNKTSPSYLSISQYVYIYIYICMYVYVCLYLL